MTRLETQTTKNHNTFSGVIDAEDFSTTSPNKKRISKYKDADELHAALVEKNKQKSKEESIMHYSLEELREMKLISNTNGRPTSYLTDEKWQKEFQIRKLFVDPSKCKHMGGKFSKDVNAWNEETDGMYYGATNYQEYCRFINDILREIRRGQCEYCYYIYQIMDLLKFHKEDLRTKYCDGYWEVWLER